jgi:hypothetical protein
MPKNAEKIIDSAPIRDRLRELQDRRRAITTRVVELEAKGVAPIAATANSTHVQALALLTGASEPVPIVADPGMELRALYDEREIIDRALHVGGLQEIQERGERTRRLMAAEAVEWRAAVRKRALLAIALQKANREFEIFQRRYAAVGGLPNGRFRLLGLGIGGADEVRGCAEEQVAAGILTKKEAFDE